MNKTLTKLVVSALLAASFLLTAGKTDVSAAQKDHVVTFIYGTKVFVEPVKDGTDAIAPTNTSVPGFTFTGWTGDLLNVTEDRVIVGAYAVDQRFVPNCNANTEYKKAKEWYEKFNRLENDRKRNWSENWYKLQQEQIEKEVDAKRDYYEWQQEQIKKEADAKRDYYEQMQEDAEEKLEKEREIYEEMHDRMVAPFHKNCDD